MSVTAIVLSRDRPAQLDLLLRSLERNAPGWFAVVVIVPRVTDAYARLWLDHGGVDRLEIRGETGGFAAAVRDELDVAGEFACFMCDDDILYRPADIGHALGWLADPAVLCFSLRLGRNTTVCYPTEHEQPPPSVPLWDWRGLDPDFGYPGSLDGHIFRTAELRALLAGREFPNPTALECALVEGCAAVADEQPLMASFGESVLVGNPVNRTSEQSNVRHGARFPASAEECERRFLAGERIDLDALDFSAVDGAHTEIELRWS